MTCPICLDALETSDIINISCGHSFHKNCIEEWLDYNITCPYCRHNLTIITNINKFIIKPINYEFKKKSKNKNLKIGGETIYDSYYQLINQSPNGFLQGYESILPIYLVQTTKKYYISYYLRQIILWNKIEHEQIYCFNDDFGRTIYHSKQHIYSGLNDTNLDLIYNWIYELMNSLSNIYMFTFTIDMNSILIDLCVNTIKNLRLPIHKFQTTAIVSVYQILKEQKIYNHPTSNLTINILIDYTDNSSKLEDFNKYMIFQNKFINKNIKIL